MTQGQGHDVVDHDLYKNLNHEKLAKLLFPESFDGNGKDHYAAKKNVMDNLILIFRNHFGLNLRLAPKNWKPEFYSRLNNDVEDTMKKGVLKGVSRCNLHNKNHCILYCCECIASRNMCSPITKLSFPIESVVCGPTNVNVVGVVDWIFFHDSHSCRKNTELLFQSGYVMLPTPPNFFTRGAYNNVITQGRKVLYDEKVVIIGNEIGYLETATKKDIGPEFDFDYIWEERNSNRARLNASNGIEGNWMKRSPCATWWNYVEPSNHLSNMVRLFYCLASTLGLCPIAASFDYEYDANFKVIGCTENPRFGFFLQEECVILGGFSAASNVEKEFKYTDCDSCDCFRSSYPDNKVEGASSLLKCGLSVITSLLGVEEHVIFIWKDSNKIKIPFGYSLVLFGNVPHGRVSSRTGNEDTRQQVWPALHVYGDLKCKPRDGKLHEVQDGTLVTKKRKRRDEIHIG